MSLKCPECGRTCQTIAGLGKHRTMHGVHAKGFDPRRNLRKASPSGTRWDPKTLATPNRAQNRLKR